MTARRLPARALLGAFLVLFALGAAGAAAAATATIPATSDIYAAGRPSSESGTLPPSTALPSGAMRVLTFASVTGEVSCDGGLLSGPDGGQCAAEGTDIESFQGLSGIVHGTRTLFLVGVFLDGTVPADPAPDRLDFTENGSFYTLAPLLRQVFFVGDGRTETGTVQRFVVPSGATRLFLGFADACGFVGQPGCYADNSGSLAATFDVRTETTATWLLPSSARIGGADNTFWTTDILLRNTGTVATTVYAKFLGHGDNPLAGPERAIPIEPGKTASYKNVLATLFGVGDDYGPILVQAGTTNLVLQSQTWTPGPAGNYGQSVPGFAVGDWIGSQRRSLVGVREDSFARTNLMLGNPTGTACEVSVVVVNKDGAPLASAKVPLAAYGFAQRNVASGLGVSGVDEATIVVWTDTPGGLFAGYASVIASGSGDPRTILPR